MPYFVQNCHLHSEFKVLEPVHTTIQESENQSSGKGFVTLWKLHKSGFNACVKFQSVITVLGQPVRSASVLSQFLQFPDSCAVLARLSKNCLDQFSLVCVAMHKIVLGHTQFPVRRVKTITVLGQALENILSSWASTPVLTQV